MTLLKIYNEEVDNIFQLIGKQENDVSYSIGWALSQSYEFLRAFVNKITGFELKKSDQISIRLQAYQSNKGYTDFEIELPGHFYLIVEAKLNWKFPGSEQIEKYVSREDFSSSNSDIRKVVVLTETTSDYTEKHFKIKKIKNIEVCVISYREIYQLILKLHKKINNIEKKLLKDLGIYLKKVTSMKDINSNKVYVVSVGSDKPDFSPLTWQEIINKKKIYFHPVGGDKGGWPVEPPNYIGFRYNGKLQSIHYIEEYKVIKNPKDAGVEFQDENWGPTFLYDLGEAIIPPKDVKTGNIFRNGRVWCALDLLLTCNTIEEARNKTKIRETESL